MYRVPQTQDEPPFTGTMVVVDEDEAVMESADKLAAWPWATWGMTGTTAFLGDSPARPPLAWGGSGTLPMDFPPSASFVGITGCFCTVDIRERRDYLVLLSLNFYFYNIAQMKGRFRITANGSATGIFPSEWVELTTSFPGNTERWIDSMMFLLPNWEPGVYRIQAWWHNDNANHRRVMQFAYIAVL